jgi:hypothetical protein
LEGVLKRAKMRGETVYGARVRMIPAWGACTSEGR